ncbi:carbohydrate ABC transporter permease [Nocardia miyunensis]|uniref:carbohydrate ABC transporter permease n=1 Tax=Nocardia miyunensis TaxID=282684 RepID=UPI00083386E6|nr:carbohydrate ABC transporter permease [Nocardia miyunensis]
MRTATASVARRLARIPTHVFLIVVCVAWVVPILGMLVSSFIPNTFSVNNGWWTAVARAPFGVNNYLNAFNQNHLGPKFLASIAIAVPTTVIGVLLCCVAAFVLTIMSLPGRRAVLLFVTALQVIPPQIVLAPLLRMVHSVGLDGTVASVWIYELGLSVPFGILVLTAAFESVPRELVEAASIDGASNVDTFLRVVVPVTRGSIAGVGVIFFLWGWNELLGPLIFIGAQGSNSPLTTTIASLAQGETQDQNLILAAAALSIVVPAAVFLALQRFFVRGVLGGAVKG